MILRAIGEIMAPAIAAAISPLAIVLVILMLVSERARTNGPAYVAGWVVGTSLIVSAAVALGQEADAATDPDTQDGLSIIRLLLGLVFVVLAIRTWRHRPVHGVEPHPPKIFDVVESMSGIQAFGLGLAISTVVNPKNLALEIGAGGTIAEVGLSAGGDIVVIAAFVLLSSIALIAPVVAVLVLGDRSMAPLGEIRDWLNAHNTAIMLVLFTVLGARFIGQGLGFSR